MYIYFSINNILIVRRYNTTDAYFSKHAFIYKLELWLRDFYSFEEKKKTQSNKFKKQYYIWT